jgi:AcrR family transcriptional regulator
MSPRRYTMKKRSSSVAETRHRIVEATLKLHGSRGIFGTSWQDIAREADVALGTVYKHFPSLEELVPACGELLMQRIQPPLPDDVMSIVGEAVEPAERLRRVTSTLFAFYERGGVHLDSDMRERELPAVQEWEQHMRSMVTHFLRVALQGQELTADQVRLASALLDVPSFRAMRIRGISAEQATEHITTIILCWLENTQQGKNRDTK